MTAETLAGGRYRMESLLGAGGMAAVYRAHDSELDRPVAIKLLAEHLATDPNFRERFVREARMAARLAHPNIVHVYDAGEDDGRPFIVMEYVEGRTLADELRERGKLPPAQAVDLALQVCGGLEHAHAASLVHRDVKPGNLLLRADGTVKIADFGIARAAESTKLTQIGSVLGTAAYLSPEQAAGEPVTAAADIYSLGCVLYEALTGQTPYTFESVPDLVMKHRDEPIRPLRELEPNVPEGLEAAVMHCLARNPEYRPGSAAELAHELAAGSPAPPTQPQPRETGVRATQVATVPLTRAQTGATQAMTRPGRRDFGLPRGGWLAAAAILAVIAIIVVLAVASSGGDEAPPSAETPRVEGVPQSSDPAEQARNLADWLREHARD
jgi:eukaryotic-like serine/threonine-protein kinase